MRTRRSPGLTDELWQAVKARQAATRHTTKTGIARATAEVSLLRADKVRILRGGFILSSRDDLRCNNNTARDTCTNTRIIKRQVLEAQVLRAMREKFFEQGAFDALYKGFTEKLNRLRREHRVQLEVAPREIDRTNRRAKEILELMLQGSRNEEWKEELQRLDERRAELKVAIAAGAINPPKPALHPHMARVFRQKAEALAAALEHDEQHDGARLALRGFLEKIVIPPGDGLLQVVGNLGEMLTAAGARNGSSSAAVGYVRCGGLQPAVLAAVERRGVRRKRSGRPRYTEPNRPTGRASCPNLSRFRRPVSTTYRSTRRSTTCSLCGAESPPLPRPFRFPIGTAKSSTSA